MKSLFITCMEFPCTNSVLQHLVSPCFSFSLGITSMLCHLPIDPKPQALSLSAAGLIQPTKCAFTLFASDNCLAFKTGH